MSVYISISMNLTRKDTQNFHFLRSWSIFLHDYCVLGPGNLARNGNGMKMCSHFETHTEKMGWMVCVHSDGVTPAMGWTWACLLCTAQGKRLNSWHRSLKVRISKAVKSREKEEAAVSRLCTHWLQAWIQMPKECFAIPVILVPMGNDFSINEVCGLKDNYISFSITYIL